MKPMIVEKQLNYSTIRVNLSRANTARIICDYIIDGTNICAKLFQDNQKYAYVPRRIYHYGQTNACRCEPHRRNTRVSRKLNTIRRI